MKYLIPNIEYRNNIQYRIFNVCNLGFGAYLEIRNSKLDITAGGGF